MFNVFENVHQNSLKTHLINLSKEASSGLSDTILSIFQTSLLPAVRFLHKQMICHNNLDANLIYAIDGGDTPIWVLGGFEDAAPVGTPSQLAHYYSPEDWTAKKEGKDVTCSFQSETFCFAMLLLDATTGFTFWDDFVLSKLKNVYSQSSVEIQLPKSISGILAEQLNLLLRSQSERNTLSIFQKSDLFKIHKASDINRMLDNMKHDGLENIEASALPASKKAAAQNDSVMDFWVLGGFELDAEVDWVEFFIEVNTFVNYPEGFQADEVALKKCLDPYGFSFTIGFKTLLSAVKAENIKEFLLRYQIDKKMLPEEPVKIEEKSRRKTLALTIFKAQVPAKKPAAVTNLFLNAPVPKEKVRANELELTAFWTNAGYELDQTVAWDELCSEINIYMKAIRSDYELDEKSLRAAIDPQSALTYMTLAKFKRSLSSHSPRLFFESCATDFVAKVIPKAASKSTLLKAVGEDEKIAFKPSKIPFKPPSTI